MPYIAPGIELDFPAMACLGLISEYGIALGEEAPKENCSGNSDNPHAEEHITRVC